MSAQAHCAIPILPAADLTASLAWWIDICGFRETFRDATPPTYSGIVSGDTHLHLAQMDDKPLARIVGDQTMVRIIVNDLAAFHAEYQRRGGAIHPNGGIQTKSWGTTEFAAIDPNGVCVTFQQSQV